MSDVFRRMHVRKWHLPRLGGAVLVAVVLSGLGIREQSRAQSTVASTPGNLGDLKQQITQYKRSGGYDRDVAAVLSNAQAFSTQTCYRP
jgi:hypothetical protein